MLSETIQKLNSLTVPQLVALFRESKVKGYKNTLPNIEAGYNNVVENYIEKVTGKTITVVRGCYHDYNEPKCYDTSPAMNEFLEMYQYDFYPDLVES